MPNHYDALLRVWAPPPELDDWWPAYRELYEVVAGLGEQHTATADRAWFAIWDGYGFGTGRRFTVWEHPPADEAERRARAAHQDRLRREDERNQGAILAALAPIPTLDRPGRTYYLLTGPVAAVADLRHPGEEGWRNPDLLWPDDRAWFVATDVDFWSLVVGGSADFVAELAAAAPTRTEPVDLDTKLPIEV